MGDALLRFNTVLDGAELQRLHAEAKTVARDAAAAAHPRYGRTYLSLHGADEAILQEFVAAHGDAQMLSGGTVALAIEPERSDALQDLNNVLGGDGAPAGITGCEVVGNAVVFELNVLRTAWPLVQALIAAELTQLNTGLRKTELLCTPSVDALAKIAADGLQAPEIDRSRILEVLLQ